MHRLTFVTVLAMIGIASACSRQPASGDLGASSATTDAVAPADSGRSEASAEPPLDEPPLDEPPEGVDVDETRSVGAKSAVPAPCVAVNLDTVAFGVRRQAIVTLPKPDPGPVGPYVRTATDPEEAERERLAWIAAKRGGELLDLLAPGVDASGCFPVAGEKLSGEAQYYVMDALQRGAAMVRDPASGNPAPSINIRYFGSLSGPTFGRGTISAALPGKPPFLIVTWWRLG